MDNEKIKNLISQMTIEEKVNICCQSSVFCSGGVERLNLPELHMADGSHGIRPEHGKHSKQKKVLAKIVLFYRNSRRLLEYGTCGIIEKL